MSDDFLKKIPAQEQAIRQKLGEATMEFVMKIAEVPLSDETDSVTRSRKLDFDVPMRRHVTENYRQAVEEAAAKGIEVSLCWHTLGVWTEEGKERIGYFSRALDCVESCRDIHLRPPGPNADWNDVHMRAECLYEIGRVHAHEGDPAVARDFLSRALPLAQQAETMRGPAGVTIEDNLEGKIAELLVQLPDEEPGK
jgi:hypothetical protein